MEQLKKDILNKVVEVKFIKNNGEERVMKCTLSEKEIKGLKDSSQLQMAIKDFKESDNLFTVWDIEEKAWRRFKYSSVIS